MGTSLVLGAGIGMAVGSAMSAQLQGEDTVTLSLFGDGTTNTGVFHEALNMASLWKVPAVFVIENNLYAEYTRYETAMPIPDLAIRSLAFGMEGRTVDGMDVVSMHEAVATAVDKARNGGGPTLIEAKTYRFSGHSRTDPAKYRTRAEVARWKRSDPIDLLIARLTADRAVTKSEPDEWRKAAVAGLDAAAARAAADPEPTVLEAMNNVFA